MRQINEQAERDGVEIIKVFSAQPQSMGDSATEGEK